MDISKLPIKPTKRDRTTHPLDIFDSLTLRGSVQNVWGPQVEALETWHKSRDRSDVVIGMNTGGGKTLVGLLIAQSLVNESRRKVFYVCPTKQLVDQTADKARECGLDAATYMEKTWRNADAFEQCAGFCITTYAALFNSKSKFTNEPLAGIVFDDAHVASSFVRSHYTLKLPQQHPAFTSFCSLFRSYFSRTNQSQEFDNVRAGDPVPLLFVPTFEAIRQADSMRRVLLDNAIASQPDTLFPWQYLKDHLSRCVILLSGTGIQISPPVLPLKIHPYFGGTIRRIYLTATLPTQVEFLRTFGIVNPETITPGGKSGDAQRLFLFMSGNTDDEQRDSAMKLIAAHKACIITSSDRVAGAWSSLASKFNGTHAGLQAFASSRGSDKLVMAARYDGVDLPGDACRVLVLDGLPTGAYLFDAFVDNVLRIERLRSSHVGVRVTQAIGRIFRSNTDHGVVLVCGNDYRRWLSDPNNQRYLPTLLQKQVLFGLELRRMVEQRRTTNEELLEAVLKGSREWDHLYNTHLGSFESVDRPLEPEWFTDLVLGDVAAYEQLWSGHLADAASRYQSLADTADPQDPLFSAWLRHWEGLAHDLARNEAAATRAYTMAANRRSALGRPATKAGLVTTAAALEPTPQAKAIRQIHNDQGQKLTATLGRIEVALKNPSQTNKVEQALEDLGTWLGLDASRPDKSSGSGPDVLWRYPSELKGVALEAKTDKKATSQYTKKDDIGQFHDHVGWLQKNHPKEDFMKVIVGPRLRVSAESHPPEDLRVVSLDQFVGLAKRLRELLEVASTIPRDDEKLMVIERGLRDMGLAWPNCIESLDSTLAIDLQTDPADVEVS